MTAAIEARNLSKTFGGERRWFGRARPPVCAVREVSFRVAAGETLGIVGESGCGKTTLARMLAGLLPPSGGRISVDGKEPRAGAGPWGGLVQYVFQDPLGALNPRKTIRQIMHAPLRHLLGMGGQRPRRGAVLRRHRRTGRRRRGVCARAPSVYPATRRQRAGGRAPAGRGRARRVAGCANARLRFRGALFARRCRLPPTRARAGLHPQRELCPLLPPVRNPALKHPPAGARRTAQARCPRRLSR